jgi:outer membrane protein assembly factor BamB
VLPNGHLLVGEVTAECVTERDRDGTVLWTYPVKDVAYVERLPNGNTFVGTHQKAVELTPDLKEVFTYSPEANFFIHSMNRKRDGHLVCLSMTGLIREVDREGKEVRTINVGMGKGNWSGVQGLPGDHYLAVEFNESRVIEVDRDGKTVWETKVQGASYALRLPTGNTMVCSFGGQRVVEVNTKGEVVWEKKVGSQPWRANFR